MWRAGEGRACHISSLGQPQFSRYQNLRAPKSPWTTLTPHLKCEAYVHKGERAPRREPHGRASQSFFGICSWFRKRVEMVKQKLGAGHIGGK